MILPDFLKKGDKVGILSTARKIDKRDIEPALGQLESWGLQPILGPTIDLECNQFAGSDEDRIQDFQNMLDNPEIKMIWCARGGYGTVRIIDALDFTNFSKQPKWIAGYSDVTIIHSHLHTLGYATLHSPLVMDYMNTTKEAYQSFQDMIFGKYSECKIAASKENRIGEATGRLIGGNLSILYSLSGSVSVMNTKGKILCIEDLDEYLYHVDRMLQGLKRSGMFEGLSGLIVGGMTKMHDNTIPFGKDAKQIILDAVRDYDFPVVFDFPFGHIEDNRTLLFGAEATLKASSTEVTLKYV
ncbi:S66 peptidase family protein [Aquimarina intermedia]|uniref:Muramoyltetrapeptide carboxypeptidase n=1 Tax=Aquimarina intermedia TaxID=350814 RepID=A0A5S5CDU7_9FLAO|nr:LD-carboxypeptidase [Aquimarina intermedia]TYP76183.1 muramoyltetrapeptide carboxypeptidase [Aquimarina intermedia]